MNEAALPQSTVHIAQADPDGILLVIHAGAGNRGKKDTPERRAQVEQDLNRALEAGYALLEQGAPAEDAVCAAIRVMEDAPEFNAGRGAALTSEGIVSMDSCLMTGIDGEVGSACGLTTSKNPINVARAIKEKTKHVMFAKPGNDLLKEWGIELCDSDYFITPARQESLREAQSNGDEWEKHGTIGAVARDSSGNIAAGTSTGGITNQMPGRVGDSPLPGCGTYANNDSVAISCTGIGEAFVKEVAAHQVSDRVLYAKEDPVEAAKAALDGVARHHGDGGMMVGTQLADGMKVLLVDDVMTAGTAVREVIPKLKAEANVEVVGLVLSVDRMEKTKDSDMSAVKAVEAEFGFPVLSIANVREIFDAAAKMKNPDGTPLLSHDIQQRAAAYLEEYGA